MFAAAADQTTTRPEPDQAPRSAPRARTPLSDDDRDILAGISVMVLAIANRQSLADQEQDEDEPLACGALGEDGQCCVREEGHSGSHKYRPINGLVN